MEQGPRQSFASIHNVSKVYHPMIRLINGTAVEQRTWLKCKYPKCKWLNWIIQNYKVSPWDLLDFVNGSRGCKYQSECALLKKTKKKTAESEQCELSLAHCWRISESTSSDKLAYVWAWKGFSVCFQVTESVLTHYSNYYVGGANINNYEYVTAQQRQTRCLK